MFQTFIHTIPGNATLNISGLNSRYKNVCIFDSNKSANDNKYTLHSKLIAIGASQELTVKNGNNALQQLQSFYDHNKGWLFGYLSYDLKNEIEELNSANHDGLHFPSLHFFVPEVVIELKNDAALVHYNDGVISKEKATEMVTFAFSQQAPHRESETHTTIKSRITQQQYMDTVNQLKKHILRGDIYEVNFCQEFFDDNAMIDPAGIFEKLNAISEAPFAAFCKFGEHYVLSSSPERFLKKQGNMLTSQPIKGTIKRSSDKTEDDELKTHLRNNLKEQNENVMIVDLVRNDLSRIAKKGSVQVDELFGVYSFKQVHQLISTVSCELKENCSFTKILQAAFPMGSMTGAPKVRAMQLIEQYESMQRGVYSGAIGYITPNGDFDFSVVIRSILYNASNHYLSFMVGSAITAKADAAQEYEECLLKAKAMFEVLGT
ncbi:MAG: aminodeoxychorismate synthase component [Bacteroidetes bacterium]|nr:aminodeoxychorismate synthase component [Bacteroidota bacterium]